MTVYKIQSDPRKYMSCFIPNEEIYAKMGESTIFHIDSTPVPQSEYWAALDIQFYTPDEYPSAMQVPAMTIWARNKLVVNEVVAKVLCLGDIGEVLPVFCEGIPYFIVNVLAVAPPEAIDTSRSSQEIEEGYFLGVESLAFIEEEVTSLRIFKTEFDRYMGLYCTESFKKQVEEADFEGLIFSKELAMSVL